MVELKPMMPTNDCNTERIKNLLFEQLTGGDQRCQVPQ
jgi:hypothetical protein